MLATLRIVLVIGAMASGNITFGVLQTSPVPPDGCTQIGENEWQCADQFCFFHEGQWICID